MEAGVEAGCAGVLRWSGIVGPVSVELGCRVLGSKRVRREGLGRFVNDGVSLDWKGWFGKIGRGSSQAMFVFCE